MNATRMWAVVTPRGLVEAVDRTRRLAITQVVGWTYGNDAWRKMVKEGYRVERVVVKEEESDE